MKNKKKISLILTIIFLCGFILNIERSRRNLLFSNTIHSSDIIEEDGGIHIEGTEYSVFSICGDYLYFYNSTNNGSIYIMELTYVYYSSYSPQLVVNNLGDVIDIDVEHGLVLDIIFLATVEYNNAIMKYDIYYATYEKILSSQWTPRKISVEYWCAYIGSTLFTRTDIVWRTASNVFYWNSLDKIIENIGPDFYGVIDVQYNDRYVLYYNSNEIRLYNRLYGTTDLYIYDTGITCAFLDANRESIIYGADDDYDYFPDGKIIQYNYDTDEITNIQYDVDYPSDIWCTANHIYWIEMGYWGGTSIIYRYSYYGYDTHYYSKVSGIKNQGYADEIEFQHYPNIQEEHFGAYSCGHYGIYVINGADMFPPDKIDWMGGTTCNKTVDYDNWIVSWQNSYDLNGIEDYELIISETEDFSNFDTYWVLKSEEHSYTSLVFSDMEYGHYYYKVRAMDTMGRDPQEESNIGEWSDTLKISYLSPEIGNQITNILPAIIISVSIIGVVISIVVYIIYRRKKQEDIIN